MAQDGSAGQPDDGTVARDEIKELQLRGVERKHAGRLLSEREKRLGTQETAADQDGPEAEKRTAIGIHLEKRNPTASPGVSSTILWPWESRLFSEQKPGAG